MHEQREPKMVKWPFFLGDALLLGAAYLILSKSNLPLGLWQTAFMVICVAGGAFFGIVPFLAEYRLTAKLAEAKGLVTVIAQVKQLESLAAQISAATGRWQFVQEEAEKTAAAARSIAERMTAEVQQFAEFMQRMNDSEKATLRLEVEKSRRAENDWVQVLVRMLDHVYALHKGALRSGQPNLIAQLGNFQVACRDAARRVGLSPFAAAEAEPFDPQRHQLVDGDGKPGADAVVEETIATGYTFQGRLLRPALVRLRSNGAGQAPVSAATEPVRG